VPKNYLMEMYIAAALDNPPAKPSGIILQCCGIILCCVMLCYVVVWCGVVWCVMLCYVVVCCVVLCYVVLCCGVVSYSTLHNISHHEFNVIKY
jgi:hypothetical protein